MGSFSDLKTFHAKVGPRKFSITVAATLALIAAFSGTDIWLSEKTGWPDAYGFQCHGRGCTLTYLYHSTELLRHGGRYEIGLFVFLWLMPAFLVGIGIFALVKRLRITGHR